MSLLARTVHMSTGANSFQNWDYHFLNQGVLAPSIKIGILLIMTRRDWILGGLQDKSTANSSGALIKYHACIMSFNSHNCPVR